MQAPDRRIEDGLLVEHGDDDVDLGSHPGKIAARRRGPLGCR